MNWRDLSSKFGGAFPPLALLSLASITYLNWQLKYISDERARLLDSFTSQTAPIAQAQDLETKLKELASGVLDLANSGDADAKAIVKKYNIARQGIPRTSP